MAFFAPQHPEEPAEKHRRLSLDTFVALNLLDIADEYDATTRAAAEDHDKEMVDA